MPQEIAHRPGQPKRSVILISNKFVDDNTVFQRYGTIGKNKKTNQHLIVTVKQSQTPTEEIPKQDFINKATSK